ncbi:MAG: hypothetical protein CME64_09660 [Halobacteriovoraceae bacterium]|nr:hypothetical protein [Halobacteriovoraceae bacterium]
MKKVISRIQEATVNKILSSPIKVLVTFLVFNTLVSAGALLLKSDFSYKVWYNPKDPLMELYREFEKNFGNDDSVMIGIQNPGGLFNKETAEVVFQLTDRLYETDDIIRVDSVFNFNDIRAEGDEINVESLVYEDELSSLAQEDFDRIKTRALANPILTGSFLDKNAEFTIVSAQLRPAHDNPPDYQEITAQVDQILSELRQKNPDLKFVALGPVILTDAFRAITISDMFYLIPFLYGLFTIVLIVLFRSFSGVALPYITIGTSTTLMFGAMGYLGLTVNTLTSAAPTILMTVALADSIHILTVFFLGLKKGLSNLEAVKNSLLKNFYPTILTTITTSLGFFSFFDAKVMPVAELGVAVGFGAIFAWLSTYFLLGPILVLLPKFSKSKHEKESITVSKEMSSPKHAYAFADFIINRKYLIASIALILGLLGLYGSKDLEVNMDPIEQFKEDHPLVNAYELIEDKLGFVGSLEIMIKSTPGESAKDPSFLKRVEALEDWLESRSYVESTLSINDHLKEINQTFHGGDEKYYRIPPTTEHVAQELLFYSMGLPPEQPIENRINAQRDAVRITAKWKLKDSLSSNAKIALIKNKIKELGLDGQVTGKTPLFHDLTPYIVEAFTHSFSIAVVTITLALWIIFQSLRLSVFAMIPSLLPLAIGAGLYAVTGFQVDMGTVLVASVCLGIAVDDSVHFLFAYRSLIGGKSLRDTIAEIVENVYPSLFNTTLLLALGFSVLMLGDYVPNAKFGASVSVVLIIALVSDFVVLPAILEIIHKEKGR